MVVFDLICCSILFEEWFIAAIANGLA